MSELKGRNTIPFEPNSGGGHVAQVLATHILTGERVRLNRVVILSFSDSDHIDHSLAEAVSAAANKLKIEPHRTIWFAHLPRTGARERYELVTFNWDRIEDGLLAASTPGRSSVNPQVIHSLFGDFSPPAEPIRVEQLFYTTRSDERRAAA